LPTRTDRREKLATDAHDIHLYKDIDEFQPTPIPIPPNFRLGDLGMSDNVADFKFELRRKLFFGTWYLKVLPIPRIGLPSGKSYDDPLEVWDESAGGRRLDFWSSVRDWVENGLFLSYEMPKSRGLAKITDTWAEWMEPEVYQILVGGTKTSRYIFGTVCEKEKWWFADIRDRVCRSW
jgi:hypothetical protein